MPIEQKRRGRPAQDITHLSPAEQDLIRRRREARHRYYYFGDARRNWIHSALKRAKDAARGLGIPCTLTLADVEALAGDTCAATGIPLVYDRGTGHSTFAAPRLERLDLTLPFNIDNTRVITQAAGLLRCPEDLDVAIMFGEWAAAAKARLGL